MRTHPRKLGAVRFIFYDEQDDQGFVYASKTLKGARIGVKQLAKALDLSITRRVYEVKLVDVVKAKVKPKE